MNTRFVHKSVLVCFLTFVLVFVHYCVFASEADNYFYTLGYRDGYTKGYMDGFRKAWTERGKRDALILQLYKMQYKALEAGKYVLKQGKVTPPRLYKILTPDGNLVYKIEGCRVEEPADLSHIVSVDDVPDLLSVCKVCSDIASLGKPQPPKWPSPVLPGATSLPGAFAGATGLSSAGTTPTIYRVSVKPRYLSLLDQYKIPYISLIEDGKERFYAVFTDKRALVAFCNEHEKVCGKVYVNNVGVEVPIKDE